MKQALIALASGLVVWLGASAVGEQASHHANTEPCREATLACAVSATPAFGPDGRLWLIWAGGGQVSIAPSSDQGTTFARPVAITRKPQKLDDGPDERPQIVLDREGRIVVAYAIFRDDHFNGQVFFASSKDNGSSFSVPRSITDASGSQRFISLSLDPGGKIFAAWIDKRNVVAAQTAGQGFVGASLAFAWSSDGGTTFGGTTIAHDHLCECCRLAVATAGVGQPVVLFRNIFDGERDHAVMTFGAEEAQAAISRVSEDHWAIDACPHHGPSLSVAEDGSYHAVWFSGSSSRRGAFYARSSDEGRTFSTPMTLGEAGHQATRPYVLTEGRDVWLAWKEFDGSVTSIFARRSRDLGRTWSAPTAIATTADSSDHPLLAAHGHRVFLSWLTHLEGYRLIPLGDPS